MKFDLMAYNCKDLTALDEIVERQKRKMLESYKRKITSIEVSISYLSTIGYTVVIECKIPRENILFIKTINKSANVATHEAFSCLISQIHETLMKKQNKNKKRHPDNIFEVSIDDLAEMADKQKGDPYLNWYINNCAV